MEMRKPMMKPVAFVQLAVGHEVLII